MALTEWATGNFELFRKLLPASTDCYPRGRNGNVLCDGSAENAGFRDSGADTHAYPHSEPDGHPDADLDTSPTPTPSVTPTRRRAPRRRPLRRSRALQTACSR